MPIPIIDPFGAMQRGMEMREKRDQYNSKQQLRALYGKTDFSDPRAIERAIPQAIAAGGPEAASSFVTLLGHMDETQRRQAKNHRDAVGRVWLQIANAPEEARPQLWSQAQGMYGSEFDQPYSPQALAGMESEFMDFDNAIQLYGKRHDAAREPPKSRTRVQGGTDIFEEWDPTIRDWRQVSSGSRWAPQQPGADAAAWETVTIPGVGQVQRNKRTGKIEGLPNQGGGVTPSQSAANAEIDAARSYLTSAGMTMEEIQRRTQEQTATGRENPDYDPYLAQTFRLAMGRKVGDDPDFQSFQQRFRGGPGAVTQPPPAISSTGGGPMMQRGADKPAPPPVQGTLVSPTVTDRPGPNGPGAMTAGGGFGEAEELPRSQDGGVDPGQLVVGKTYSVPGTDGSVQRFQWTGTDFVQVQ